MQSRNRDTDVETQTYGYQEGKRAWGGLELTYMHSFYKIDKLMRIDHIVQLYSVFCGDRKWEGNKKRGFMYMCS